MSFMVLDRLTKIYGDQAAVDALSIHVEQGEFISLLGPSGCGKSTTLQMIAGFVEPSSGSIQIGGRDFLAIRPNRRGLGIVFQSYALFPHMTVAENVSFGLEMQRVPPAERGERVRQALALVGLADFAERYPRRLSGGQQQRVALARALVIRPNMLLLDEPLSNLDAKLREDMQVELRQIHRTAGATTLLVTHDQAEALALSDRIVVLNKGRVEQIGTPFEVYERPATPFVAAFLGKTNVMRARMNREAAGAQITIGSSKWLSDRFVDDEVFVSVRPEKIDFASEGPHALPGTVSARIFQGNHWLYHVETAFGLITVIRQNSGLVAPAEGAQVHLAIQMEDMTIRATNGAHA